jgi:hypothetical protein
MMMDMPSVFCCEGPQEKEKWWISEKLGCNLNNLLNAMFTFIGQTMEGSHTITRWTKETLVGCKKLEEIVFNVGPIVINNKGFWISVDFQVC